MSPLRKKNGSILRRMSPLRRQNGSTYRRLNGSPYIIDLYPCLCVGVRGGAWLAWETKMSVNAFDFANHLDLIDLYSDGLGGVGGRELN